MMNDMSRSIKTEALRALLKHLLDQQVY